MFESGRDCGFDGASAFDPSDDRPSRRQYTLKGVDVEAVRLMRDAASKEGMKIGSWVSLRMREAAERALSAQSVSRPAASGKAPDVQSEEVVVAVQQLVKIYETQIAATNERFQKLERELHEITSGQRTIMSVLLSSKC